MVTRVTTQNILCCNFQMIIIQLFLYVDDFLRASIFTLDCQLQYIVDCRMKLMSKYGAYNQKMAYRPDIWLLIPQSSFGVI